ncbi:hypothetical protein ACFL6C_14340, partial [Myxococcota bacterium]
MAESAQRKEARRLVCKHLRRKNLRPEDEKSLWELWDIYGMRFQALQDPKLAKRLPQHVHAKLDAGLARIWHEI